MTSDTHAYLNAINQLHSIHVFLNDHTAFAKAKGDPLSSSHRHQVTVTPAHEMASTQRKMDRLGTSAVSTSFYVSNLYCAMRLCIFYSNSVSSGNI